MFWHIEAWSHCRFEKGTVESLEICFSPAFFGIFSITPRNAAKMDLLINLLKLILKIIFWNLLVVKASNLSQYIYNDNFSGNNFILVGITNHCINKK